MAVSQTVPPRVPPVISGSQKEAAKTTAAAERIAGGGR